MTTNRGTKSSGETSICPETKMETVSGKVFFSGSSIRKTVNMCLDRSVTAK